MNRVAIVVPSEVAELDSLVWSLDPKWVST